MALFLFPLSVSNQSNVLGRENNIFIKVALAFATIFSPYLPSLPCCYHCYHCTGWPIKQLR